MAKEKQSSNGRLPVAKTYKLFIGGAFPRTESGRTYSLTAGNKPIANMCLASRKDVRNAIVAARAAQPGWAGRSAYNRCQILYRIGEILEGRRDQFIAELKTMGLKAAEASAEVDMTIDRLVYFAGWCDKYQQIFSSVNPVASSHFNFSVLEPMGVVFIVANEQSPLLGLVSLMAPVIASGNTCVVLASNQRPMSSVTLAEVMSTSDVPGGVVNILTGSLDELVEHFSMHLDLNAIAFDRDEPEAFDQVQKAATGNLKRVRKYSIDWTSDEGESPWLIEDFCETKTTWHPIEKITESGSGY